MNQKSTRILPSLAHPLLIDGEKDEKPIHLPPFSDINLNWAAFTLSHLHWVGINKAKLKAEDWQLFLVVAHEGYHKSLTNTPFSQHKKYRTLLLSNVIQRTFGDGNIGVEVPLDPYKSRNELEKEWGYVAYLIWESQLVEEVFAVRSSLFDTQKDFKISHGVRRDLEDVYKKNTKRLFNLFLIFTISLILCQVK